ncbi:MAG: cell division protein FtsZ, partial [Massilibacteroides sp.]|nr:cell division protein FtsZ [Massilibacteroides sp.]
MDKNTLDFDLEQRTAERIKVIGVGGGGGNAVSHMYKEGIQDVTFLLCNTDVQALKKADIPTKIMLGATVTQGLGAGNRPERARMAAEESADDIQALLNDGTKMVFITAGMGGGTGTGAAPIIAKIAKDMGILTVGIVTIPFRFEGERKIMQALEGVELLGENVDALLVINNERLRMLYPDLTVLNAFAKADDTLTTAAKSIAEIITIEGYMNLDFADVESTMKDGGVALMSNGFG